MNTLLAAALVLFASGELFTSQPLNDIEIGAINPYIGQYSTNFRLHDMNKDGSPDLVFTDHIRLQQNGQFPESSVIPFPQVPQAPVVDVFAGKLYFKSDHKVRIFQLHELDWIESPPIETPWQYPAPIDTPQGKEWGSFMVDLEGHGAPEILHPNREGLDLLPMKTANSTAIQHLNIFPSPRLIDRAPSQQSRLRFGYRPPEFELSFRCILENENIYIIESIPTTEDMNRYTVRRYTFTESKMESAPPATTAPLPIHMRPCIINDDAQIDYAGGILRYPSNTAVIAPIYEFTLSIDGGKTRQFFHSRSFMPHTYFLDYNRDGLKDLLLEETSLGDGGLRQTVSRLTAQRKIRHQIHIYQQQPGGIFPSTPTVSKEFTVRLDKPPINKSTMFQRYQNGFLVNAIGNINGDDFSDLVVQATPERLQIYFGSMSGYIPTPQAELDIPPDARFYVLDINGDHRDDIVISANATDPADHAPQNIVYYFDPAQDTSRP